MAGIMQGKQPAGKVREVLDGKEEEIIRYRVYIPCDESLADNLLSSVLRTSRRRFQDYANSDL